jgi:hypothetical protein
MLMETSFFDLKLFNMEIIQSLNNLHIKEHKAKKTWMVLHIEVKMWEIW